MFIELNTQDATVSELRALAALCTTLADGDFGTDSEPEAVVATAQVQAETTKPRRRRGKAEVEAEAVAAEVSAVADAEAAAQASNEAAVAEIEAAATTEQPAETPVQEDWAAGSTKTYTEAEVQQLASTVARTHGPQIVKEKIAALGADRIAGLSVEKLNELGAYLEANK